MLFKKKMSLIVARPSKPLFNESPRNNTPETIPHSAFPRLKIFLYIQAQLLNNDFQFPFCSLILPGGDPAVGGIII
jgi:hypothetical protein